MESPIKETIKNLDSFISFLDDLSNEMNMIYNSFDEEDDY